MAKSPFTKKQLNDFEKLLLEKKAYLLEDIQKRSNHAESDKMSGDLADQAGELLEDEMDLIFTGKDKEALEEINEALARIVDKTYGICVDTNEPININRLEARPMAKRSLKAQEKYDKKMSDLKRLGRAV